MPHPLTSDFTRRADARRPVVLLVDADAAALRVATAAVANAGGEVLATLAPDVAADFARSRPADIAIVDVPDREALAIVEALGACGLTVVATSGAGSVALAVEAMRRGAVDFVLKPYSPETLARRLTPRFEERRLHATEPVKAESSSREPHDFADFVGRSAPMQALYEEIVRIAPSRAPVFVTGESGSGKELCAEAIHARSGRAQKPLVALNCGAIPRELMESEIFGHVRGAFTGATDDRVGAVEAAAGGTLFLDEIGEMELSLQSKLLRVLQTGEFRRVGDPRPRRADVRIVCATHRDPFAEVAAGRFRQDLFYRLHVLPIRLPALRERGDDVIALASAFLDGFAREEGRSTLRLSPAVADLFRRYDWPGNVRELQNVIRRAVVLGEGDEITPEMLPPELRAPRAAAPESSGFEIIEPFWLQERRIIERAVAAFDGNTARAAAALEISPSTIYRKRERWAELAG